MRTRQMEFGPLVWLRSLEMANDPPRHNGVSLWSSLGMRAKLREQAVITAELWPAYVYAPAHVVEPLVLTDSIKLPPEWEGMSSSVTSRLIAVLASWNLDRRIYQFTPLAAKVVRNSRVDVPLSVRPFVMMPGFAMYVDLSAVREEGDSLPYGILASLNVRANGMPELVLVLDHGTSLDLKAYPLNGKMPDQIFDEFQKSWKDSAPGAGSCGELPTAVSSHGADLQILLAAILMTCVNQPSMRQVAQDISLEFGALADVSVWQVGKQVYENFYGTEIPEEVLLSPSTAVVAEWASTDGKNIIELKCAAAVPGRSD